MRTEAPRIAKLSSPRMRGLVPRERLFALLDRALGAKAVWIHAEPGAGKTSLLASFLAARKLSATWYQVDEGDRDAATLFYFLGRAASGLPGSQAPPLPLLTPEYQQDLPSFSRRFFREMYAAWVGRAALVFDDFHRLGPGGPHGPEGPDGTTELVDCVLRAIEDIPSPMTLFIVSRVAPPDSLARLLANGDLAEIEAGELRLDIEEARSLLAIRNVHDPLEVQRIHEQVDGWAAGLVLLSTRPAARTADPPMVNRTGRVVFDYFAAEAFDRANAETQQLLLATALFPRFTESMALAISGNSRAATILARLTRDHFFVQIYEGDPPSWRFHPLFRAFLLERGAQALGLHELTRMRSHAAALLEQWGLVEDAIALHASVANWSGAIALIVREAPALLQQGRSQTLQRWIAGLSAEQVERSAPLLYWLGLSQQHGQPAEARALLERSFEQFQRSRQTVEALAAAAAAAECLVLEWSDLRGLDRWIAVFERAVKRYPHFATLTDELRVLPGMLAAFVYRRSQHPLCARLIERADGLMHEHPFLANRMLLGALAYYRAWMGDYVRMEEVVAFMRRLTSDTRVAPLTLIWWHCAKAYFDTLRADFAAAFAETELAAQVAREHDLHGLDSTIALRAALAGIASGDLARAAIYCAQAAGKLDPRRQVETCTFLRVQGWIELQRGDRSKALALLRRGVEAATLCGMEVVEVSSQIVWAIALCEDGRFDEADELLRAVRLMPLAQASPSQRFICDLTEARFALKRGQAQRLAASLSAAFALGREYGLLSQTYNWDADNMAALCEVALANGIEPEYTRRLIRTHGLRASADAPAGWPWHVELRCLGGFEVVLDGAPMRSTGKVARKPLELLQLLVAKGPQGAHAEELSALIWPDAEGDSAQNSLHQAVHRLRQLLGQDATVKSQEGRLQLDTTCCRVDSWAFSASAARADGLHRPADDASALTRAGASVLQAYRGPFLRGESDRPWLLAERDRLHSLFLRTVSTLGHALERQGLWSDARQLYLRALEEDNLAEEMTRRLMRCCIELGQAAEGLAAYRRCKDALSISARLQPAAETTRLYDELFRIGGRAGVSNP